MAIIAGVNIPDNQRLEIALTAIYGIGRSTSKKIVADSDLFYPGKTRRVIYRQGANEYPMELIPYVHSGATLTLGSLAYDANNVATYTPTLQNRIILHGGAGLAGAGALVRTIAGVLMADYYTHWDDNSSKRDDHHALTLEAGDFIWLIRRGLCYVDCDGAISDDAGFIMAANGEATASAAIGTGSVAALATSLLENTEGLNYAKKVGEARATVSGAGQGLVEMMLPRDFRVV